MKRWSFKEVIWLAIWTAAMAITAFVGRWIAGDTGQVVGQVGLLAVLLGWGLGNLQGYTEGLKRGSDITRDAAREAAEEAFVQAVTQRELADWQGQQQH